VQISANYNCFTKCCTEARKNKKIKKKTNNNNNNNNNKTINFLKEKCSVFISFKLNELYWH